MGLLVEQNYPCATYIENTETVSIRAPFWQPNINIGGAEAAALFSHARGLYLAVEPTSPQNSCVAPHV